MKIDPLKHPRCPDAARIAAANAKSIFTSGLNTRRIYNTYSQYKLQSLTISGAACCAVGESSPINLYDSFVACWKQNFKVPLRRCYACLHAMGVFPDF